MYETYWGLSSLPFQIVSDPDKYFPSSVHEEARSRISYAIKYGKGAALFTGEVGIGKTTVTNVVIKRLADNNIDVAMIFNPLLCVNDFLREILYQMKVKSTASTKLDLIHDISDKLASNYHNRKTTVLIIDEAHLITDMHILEEIRLLLNYQIDGKFLLTVILVGQPELRKIIRNITSLEQRLTIKFHLRHLSLEGTNNYIFHRLKHAGARESLFTFDAIKLIHEHTDGIPRRINQICDLSLLVTSYEKKYNVDLQDVRKVIADEAKHRDEND
ncbi:MAG: AAA family ATPase [Nitrospirae bacterium]|nr:AAA family ATPase [Nitrospirota bacterium]